MWVAPRPEAHFDRAQPFGHHGGSLTPYKLRHLPSDRFLAVALEIAETPRQRRVGLLGRAGLDEGEGMLFPGTWSIHTFGMAFSIDVAFLDSELGVRALRPNLAPRRLAGSFLAAYAVELPAGTLARLAVAPGDLLRIEKHVAPVSRGPDEQP